MKIEFTSIVASILTALITSIASYSIYERRLREELRTEFMAEQVALKLLESPEWTKRSFDEIKKRLLGFNDDELRRILVRAGAVCFEGKNKEELWGLLSRNENSV
jgi:hypothetical protein